MWQHRSITYGAGWSIDQPKDLDRELDALGTLGFYWLDCFEVPVSGNAPQGPYIQVIVLRRDFDIEDGYVSEKDIRRAKEAFEAKEEENRDAR